MECPPCSHPPSGLNSSRSTTPWPALQPPLSSHHTSVLQEESKPEATQLFMPCIFIFLAMKREILASFADKMRLAAAFYAAQIVVEPNDHLNFDASVQLCDTPQPGDTETGRLLMCMPYTSSGCIIIISKS